MTIGCGGGRAVQIIRFLFAFEVCYFEMAQRLYLVAYDLSLPLPYESLKTRLTTMGAQQLLDRVWAVLMSESADEIKRTLRSFVDDKDRILVAEVGHDWASRRALFRLGELIEPAGGSCQSSLAPTLASGGTGALSSAPHSLQHKGKTFRTPGVTL